MTAPLFDTHCHLQDPLCVDDIAGIVARAGDAGVEWMLLCGYDVPSNARALELARKYTSVYPAVGFHPHDASAATPALLRELEAQVGLPEVLAVGEIGLDYYRDLSPRDVQRKVLGAQLEIALRAGKPVSVHSRAAEDAVFEPLAQYAGAATALRTAGRPPGIMHCFGGTAEQAWRFAEIGFLVSIACTVTYPGNEAMRRTARELPLQSLVVETDAPYLPPQGKRGAVNEPANVVAAVEAIAGVRGIPVDEVARATSANAARTFGLEIAAGAIRR